MSQPIYELTATEIHKRFCSGEFTALQIVDAFLARIDAHDSKVGAFLTVFHERAREKAKALDVKKGKGEHVGTLAGIPIAIKDNIHVEGEITTCSSKFLTNYKAPFSATATSLLEAEDAILIGKTNLDEFAMGSSSENSALLTTRNPWDLNCVPGGSSGGSAAAVAARFCPIALGSETGGSVRQPASLCGITGFKPTYGRVSRFGLVAFGSSLDQISPFANHPDDIAKVMEVIGAPCERDSTSLPDASENYLDSPLESFADQTIGVPYDFLEGLDEEIRVEFDASIETLKKAGATIESIDLSILKHSIPVYYILSTAEASTNLARFDGIRYGNRAPEAKTLAEVYDLSKEQGFGPEVKRRILTGTYVLSAGYQDAYYKKAQRIRTLMIENFKKIFKSCSLIALPTSPSTAFPIGSIQEPEKMYLEDIYTIAANLTGTPAISVPAGLGKSSNKPIGLQLMGPQKQDRFVVTAAAAFAKKHPSSTLTPPAFE